MKILNSLILLDTPVCVDLSQKHLVLGLKLPELALDLIYGHLSLAVHLFLLSATSSLF
jgi:hypothetical protein